MEFSADHGAGAGCHFFRRLIKIKTPLTLLKNYMYLYSLKAVPCSELEILQHNIDKLCADITSFFDLEAMQLHKVAFDHTQVCNFSVLVNDKLPLFKSLARKKRIIFKTEFTPALPVQADPAALDRIINNLLDNAVKYAPESSTIQVKVNGNGQAVCFSVSNEGEGIPAGAQAHIFEPYHQLSHNTPGNRGMGLGLPLVREIVEQLTGTLTLMSTPGQGATFSVTLPQASTGKFTFTGNDSYTMESSPIRPAAVLPEAAELPEVIFDETKPVILLVEDNSPLCTLLHIVLKEHYNIFHAANGREAMELLEANPKPDLIISDVAMDVMDGYALLEQITANTIWRDIPFIFLTARSSENEKIKAFSLGAVDYITKPFAVNALLAKIQALLMHRQIVHNADRNEFEAKITRALSKSQSGSLRNSLDKYNFTARERDVLELLYKGMQYKEISNQMNISLAAVRKRVHSIYNKLNVQNKAELILAIDKEQE